MRRRQAQPLLRALAWGGLLVAALGAGVGSSPGTAGAAAHAGSAGYEAARRSYQSLLAGGPEARDPAAWRRTAETFRAAAAAPSSPELGGEALYVAGICLERANGVSGESIDLSGAAAAYRAVADRYPQSPRARDALLRAGRARELAGDADGARAHYRKLLAAYPDADEAAAARQRLERVGREAVVEGLRFFTGPDYTRVVVDLSDPVPFAARRLPRDPAAERPERVFLDLVGVRLGPEGAGDRAVSDGLVRQVRCGQYDPCTARVVLDLDAPAEFRAFALEAPARIVVDVFRKAPPGDLVASLIPGRSLTSPKSFPARRPRLVIDPGHGGKDPGAVGVGGLQEKDVTLAIALELADLLRRDGVWDVKLTRDWDRTVSLEERTAIANAFGADLFVSIHANASPNREARGIETYYLDRASDRAARRLAARENAGAEVAAAEMEHILADVVVQSKLRDSRRLAEAVQGALVGHLSAARRGVRDLGVKRGPFYVLTGAFMPSVLVEVAFLSHPEEARWLRDPAFRRETAKALARGLGAFSGGS